MGEEITFGMMSKGYGCGKYKKKHNVHLPKPQIPYNWIGFHFLHFFQLRGILNGGANLNTYTNQLQKNVSPVITSEV